MDIDKELIKLAKEFRLVYENLCCLEVSDNISPTNDISITKTQLGEFVEILEVPDLEKGVLIGLKTENNQEKVDKFPVAKLHYDLASTNPYLSILKIYVENLELLKLHFDRNPTTKIVKMMASVGLLNDLLYGVFSLELKMTGLNFLEDCDNRSLAGIILKRVSFDSENPNFLLGFAKKLITCLSDYPLDISRSPRSETDLIKLEKHEKEILYEFYIEAAGEGILYIYDSKTQKPYYLQILIRALSKLHNRIDQEFDWKMSISKWFFSNIIVPFLMNPPENDKVLSPRKECSPRTKERKSSINSGIDRWRYSFGSRKFKRNSDKLFNPMTQVELNKYFNDVGRIYLSLFYSDKQFSTDDNTGFNDSATHLKFLCGNFPERFLIPSSPRPKSDTDYFFETEEIYEELKKSNKIELEDDKFPSRDKCIQIQNYLDKKFNL